MAGRKQWAPFERLNAADVNKYLADQSVMRFDTAASRDAAIPLPIVGMMVARADNGGKPEYWDGSAWTLVTAGSQVQQLLTRIEPTGLGILRGPSEVNLSNSTWTEITPGLTDSVMIYGFFHRANASIPIEIGTGPAGSEKIRWISQITNSSVATAETQYPLAYGIFVPANTRIAYRGHEAGVLGSNIRLDYSVFPVDGVVADFAVAKKGLPTTATSAWQEVAAAPPIATGAYIIGAHSNRELASGHTFQLGFGAAGAETAATGNFHVAYPNNGVGSYTSIPPILWPANTRLALKTTHNLTNSPTISFMLRNHLT